MLTPQPSFGESVRAFARIGLLSFGGPAGQIATMHRIVVDEKGWVGEARFLHALNYCMLLPGPEAQQLATYVGWLLHGIKGGIAAGVLFILPGFLVMMGLAALYAGFQDVTFVQGLFYGLKPAVLAVVVEAVLRIGKRGLKSREMWAISALAFVAIFFLGVPFPAIVIGAGLVGFLAARAGHPSFAVNGPEVGEVGARPASWRATAAVVAICLVLWAAPVVLALGVDGAFGALGVFFSKMAVVTFGGAYAVLAYVAQQAVDVHGWLAPGEMLDGLGLAETTPGPLILVNQFVGFLAGFRQPGGLDPWLGGMAGAALAVWVTFLPSFLWIFAGAPYVERLRGNRALSGALAAITAAVVGVILNLAVWFAMHVAFTDLERMTPDWPSIALGAAAMVAMLRFKLGMVPVLAGSALLGLIWTMS